MAFTLGTVITAARDRHPAMHKTRCPDAVLARYLTDIQNELIVRAVSSEPTFLAQTATVSLTLNSDDAIGSAGAGTDGGVPGTVDTAGDVAASQHVAGSLVTVGTTAEDGATVVVSERVVTSATATTITSTGAGRTTDADIGRLVVIVAGTGAGQFRDVVANSADTWTVEAWETVPDSTSTMTVVTPAYDATEAASVVTQLPATESRTGFLVKLNASGTPYLDYTAPITTTIDTGVPLPTLHALIGGTVWMSDGDAEPLLVTTYAKRGDVETRAVYQVGETIRFVGDEEDWADVLSLELLYTPVAPAFTQLTDLFLLPDQAKACVVAKAAAFMAVRVAGMPEVEIDPSAYLAMAEASERTFLNGVRLSGRGRTLLMRGQD